MHARVLNSVLSLLQSGLDVMNRFIETKIRIHKGSFALDALRCVNVRRRAAPYAPRRSIIIIIVHIQ